MRDVNGILSPAAPAGGIGGFRSVTSGSCCIILMEIRAGTGRMKKKKIPGIRVWILAVFAVSAVAASGGEATKSVLFIAGPPSHGTGEHEFPDSCRLLADALDASGLAIRASVHEGAWPEEEQLRGADAVVLYCDGNEDHLLLGKESALLGLAGRGTGLVVLHYALDGIPGPLDDALLQVVGGCYDDEESENPLWEVKNPVLANHPVTRGVHPFELKDEYYYNLRFDAIRPLLQAVPPEEERAHVLAWTFGKNRFGFTGGHYHSSWGQPDFRTLVLNAIVWAAGLEVPEQGVKSDDPVVVKTKSILHAIAKGDEDDLKNHLLLGADINETNAQGWTPLHFAAVRGQAGCAKVLVSQGARLDMRTGTEKTPLHFAADRGFLEITETLLAGGADLAARDDEGWTPLHYAAEKDRVDVAACLIKAGSEVDARSRRGGTPLHEAAASASPEMIRLLLGSGAEKAVRADNGKTPHDYALELDNKPVQELLK
jgi:hypothetical protein